MEYVLTPLSLTVLTTDKCTAKCSHCCMNSSPKRSGAVDVEATVKTIEKLTKTSRLRVVIFAGGEPTLLKHKLLEMISRTAALGINTRLVTNGSWAVTPAKAEAMIAKLRGAGLHELNVSTDDYHLPFIPFTNVVNAWNAARGVGFRAVVVATCSHPQSRITPEFIEEQLGEQLPKRFDEDGIGVALPPPAADGTIYMLSNSHVQLIGRAGRELDASHHSVPADQGILDMPCPFAVRSAAITPRNHLVACCGFELEGNPILDFGKVSEADTLDLALRAANDDVLVAAIALYGPKYVMEFVKSKQPDMFFRDEYASVCEICEHVVGRPEVVDVVRSHSGEMAADVLRHPAYQTAEAEAAE